MFNLKKYKNNIAVITEKYEKYTYEDLYNIQLSMMNFVEKRKLMIILCENTMGCLIGYIFCIIHSVVPLMLDSHICISILESYLNKYCPDYIWMPKAIQNFDNLETIYEDFGYKLIRYNTKHCIELNNELAVLLTTSGSTGNPKTVRISYNNLISNTEAIIKYLEIDEKERSITSLPLYYTYGLSVVNTHLYAGACVLLTKRSVVSKDFWAFFNKFKGTSFSGVPYTYDILRKCNFISVSIPTLKTLTQAGGALSKETNRFFYNYSLKNRVNFFVMYGQTEATARMCYLPYKYMGTKLGSIGIPISGGRVELIDEEEGIINTPNKIGEIIYYGKNVSLGYAYNREDLFRGDDNKGILHTGDLSYYDSDGFLYFCGRQDRIIKIMGKRIDLNDLEEKLRIKYSNYVFCFYRNKRLQIIVRSEEKYFLKSSIETYISKLTGIHKLCLDVVLLPSLLEDSFEKTDYNGVEKIM